jgi:hypothetical protein
MELPRAHPTLGILIPLGISSEKKNPDLIFCLNPKLLNLKQFLWRTTLTPLKVTPDLH